MTSHRHFSGGNGIPISSMKGAKQQVVDGCPSESPQRVQQTPLARGRSRRAKCPAFRFWTREPRESLSVRRRGGLRRAQSFRGVSVLEIQTRLSAFDGAILAGSGG